MDCERKGKWMRGCKFEPRYDLGPADISRLKRFEGFGAEQIVAMLRAKTYRGDICVTCGRVVNESKGDS